MIERKRGLPWKYMVMLMASGVPVCLLLLVALSRMSDGLHYIHCVGVAAGFVLSCLFLLLFNWAWSRQSTATKQEPNNRRT